MHGRLLGILVAFAVVAAPANIAALDSPHDREDAYTACYHCHNMYQTTPSGGRVYSQACLDCHAKPSDKPAFGFPWTTNHEAIPGTSGVSHNWSGAGVNPRYGANTQLGAGQAATLLVDGKLQCAVCHNPHTTADTATTQSMHVSIPVGTAAEKSGSFGDPLAGTAWMTLAAVPPGTLARGFRLKIQSAAAGSGTFVVTHDAGWSPGGWLNWNGSWVVGTGDGPGRPFQTDVEVELDIPGIKVKWSAGAVAGDYWDFYIAYPFLRTSNAGDGACYQCHKERVMNHLRARGLDRYYRPDGARKFSHPVGDGLNANGFGSDRSVILDADGTAGVSTGDGAGNVQNDTNNLVLKGGAVVCTTCHAAHNADSNSLSVDAH